MQLVKQEAADNITATTTEAKLPEAKEATITTTPLSITTTDLIEKEDVAAALEDEEEELGGEEDRQQQKRNTPLKQKYNNWFGRNDWSRRIQKVQGRIRFKNQNN